MTVIQRRLVKQSAGVDFQTAMAMLIRFNAPIDVQILQTDQRLRSPRDSQHQSSAADRPASPLNGGAFGIQCGPASLLVNVDRETDIVAGNGG